jgi:L-alanine-DL-glutamate epimerase-like enolase superfamily enzyme
MRAIIQKVSVCRVHVPLRRTVVHAAARHTVAESAVVRIELHGGQVGFGETVARSYVTGETTETVHAAIGETFVPVLLSFSAASFPEALTAIESLPWKDRRGHRIPAARAAVEIALLDACMKAFGRNLEDAARWLGLTGFFAPGSLPRIRFSGVLAEDSIQNTKRRLRVLQLAGLRELKIHVGLSNDQEKMAWVVRKLKKGFATGGVSLRADANGVWSYDEAQDWLGREFSGNLAAMEQPLTRSEEERLADLRAASRVPIFHDESLVTIDDARRLIDRGVADGFNLRISKCGGILPSLQIAALARRHGVRLALGCMTGETSILSGAALRFLEVCPDVEWAEGCHGTRLLSVDPVRKSLKFGYGGRPPRILPGGMGVDVDEAELHQLSEESATVFRF